MKNSIRRALAAVTALTLGTGFALGAASAANAVPDTWTITSLTTDNGAVVDTVDQSGDDGGLLGVTQKYVLRDGDDDVWAFDLATLAPAAAATDADPGGSFVLVSDLKSNKSYQMEVGEVTADEIDSLVELDVDGNVTTTVVTLSESIAVGTGDWFVMSGFGWIGMWDYTTGALKTIDPASGTVTTITSSGNMDGDFVVEPEAGNAEGVTDISAGGVGMYDGTDYWFVGTDTATDISKFNITGSATQTTMLENADNQSDSDTFMVSPCANRLFIHTENDDGDDDWTSFFGQSITGMEEPLVSFDATFSSSGTCSQEPELPNTGVNAGATAALVALLATLGLAGVVIARRRQVTTK